MAELTITNRRVNARGSWKEEFGDFTDVGGGNYEIRTKLARIDFFKMVGRDHSDTGVDYTLNSTTDGGAPDDPGIVHVAASPNAQSGGLYMYHAVGVG